MCFAANTFGAGGKTRLEYSIKKFKPHLIYDRLFRPCTSTKPLRRYGYTLSWLESPLLESCTNTQWPLLRRNVCSHLLHTWQCLTSTLTSSQSLLIFFCIGLHAYWSKPEPIGFRIFCVRKTRCPTAEAKMCSVQKLLRLVQCSRF